MGLQQQLAIRSKVLKGHVNQYAMIGLVIAIGSIIIASSLVSFQLTGAVSLYGIFLAQTTNPAIWALDLTPFMFAYWGQSFCVSLASKAESIIEDKEREYAVKSGDLESKLKHESNHDSLTNLPNIKLLNSRLDHAIKSTKEDVESTALMIVSINHFRDINYKVGSFSSNSLLVQFADKLKSILLEPYMLQAYMGMNMVARIQSAEFAILIPRLRKEHELEKIVKQILNGTSSTYMIDGHKIEVKTTVGIAVHPPHGENAKEVIDQASLALISAEKENLRSRMFEESMTKNLKSKRVLINELDKAIKDEEFTVLFEPIVDLSTNLTVGFDTRIEFTDEKYQDLTVERLISTADGTDVLKRLSVLVLKYVGDVLEKLYKENQSVYVRVFLFEVDDPDLPKFLKQILSSRNIPARCLKLEITEQTCLRNQSKTIDILNELQQLGIDISICDFGSGYSSFIYLTNFPIKTLKISKNFAQAVVNDEKKHLIVKALVQMAEALELSTIADGVQNQDIKQALTQLGCHYGKGEYFTNPLNEKEMYGALSQVQQAKI